MLFSSKLKKRKKENSKPKQKKAEKCFDISILNVNWIGTGPMESQV